MSNVEAEEIKNEYLADNDVLEGLNKTMAESEIKFERQKQEYEANYDQMVRKYESDISRKEKSNSDLKNTIEKIGEEYQAIINSLELIAEIAAKDKKIKSLEMSNVEAEEIVISNKNKIQGLENLNDVLMKNLEETTEIVSNSMEENRKDCEKLEALQKVVTTKNNKIQGLENSNANLRYKLEGLEKSIAESETKFEKLKQANEATCYESDLKDCKIQELKTELEKNKQELTLKENMIDSLERSKKVESELEKTKQDDFTELVSKIQHIEALEKMQQDCEEEIGAYQTVVTAKNNEIRGLENLNANQYLRLQVLEKSMAESETKFEKLKRANEATSYEKMEEYKSDVYREYKEKFSSAVKHTNNTIEKIREEYHAERLEMLKDKLELEKNEENRKDCEKEISSLQNVVTSNNSKIQSLENLNANLKHKLEETTENLKYVRNKLHLQNQAEITSKIKLKKMEENRNDCLKEIETFQEVVTSNNDKIQGLANLNVNLKCKLEETTENLKDVRNKLNFQKQAETTSKKIDIQGLEEVKTKLKKMEENRNDCEKEIEAFQFVVTSNNNKITDLENLNANLKHKLEETTKNLKEVRNILNVQNQAEITSKKIDFQGLEGMKTKLEKMEENRNDCLKEIEAFQEVVTSNNDKVQGLSNLNANLKHKLEETTETLNDVKSKLLLQNEVRQKDYKDYEANLGSKNTTIKNLEIRLETFEKYIKDEVNLTKSLKQTNADLEAKLDKVMHENKTEISSENIKIQELVEMNIGVKTKPGNQEKTLIVEIKLDEIRKNFQDAMEVISRRNDKIKDLVEIDIAAKTELEKIKQELEAKNNDIKSFETELAALKEGKKTDAKIKLDLLEVIGKEDAKFVEILEKTKQDHVRELESKNKDIKFLENQLKTHKNTLKESNADSKAQLKRVLKRYQAETIANSNKIKEFENLNIESQAKWDTGKFFFRSSYS